MGIRATATTATMETTTTTPLDTITTVPDMTTVSTQIIILFGLMDPSVLIGVISCLLCL